MGGDGVGKSSAGPRIIGFFVDLLAKLIAVIVAAAVILGLLLITGTIHIRHSPTPDELFGCTWANTTPAGECK